MFLIARQKIEISGIYKGFIKTIIYNRKGIIKAVIPPENKQPNQNEENVIVINCYKYRLIFKNHGNIC